MAKTLTDARTAKRLSQTALALRSDVSQTYISELDRVLAYPDAIIEAAWHNLSDSPLNAPRELTVERLHSEMLGYKLFGIFRKLST